MNDHFIVTLPEHTMAIIEVKGADGEYRSVGRTDFEAKQKLVEIDAEGKRRVQ